MVLAPERKPINQEQDKLMKEIADLKQANQNILSFTFGIIETLENHGKQLVASGNTLFILSNKLREIVQKSQKE